MKSESVGLHFPSDGRLYIVKGRTLEDAGRRGRGQRSDGVVASSPPPFMSEQLAGVNRGGEY